MVFDKVYWFSSYRFELKLHQWSFAIISFLFISVESLQ